MCDRSIRSVARDLHVLGLARTHLVLLWFHSNSECSVLVAHGRCLLISSCIVHKGVTEQTPGADGRICDIRRDIRREKEASDRPWNF